MPSKNLIDLSGSVAVITGGSRGIGAATAILMADAGADIAILYRRDRQSARAVMEKVVSRGKKCLALRANISKASEVRAAVSAVTRRFKKIDILVNNAGIWTYGEIGKMDEKTWDEAIDVNLKGIFNACTAIVPHMKRLRHGRIINVASTAGLRGEPFYSHYAASKGGVIAFSRSLAIELAPYGVHVNCVAPGWVETDMTSGVFASKSFKRSVLKSIPRGKIATPEEIAGAIVFLASDLADNMVGAVLSVNGGNVLVD